MLGRAACECGKSDCTGGSGRKSGCDVDGCNLTVVSCPVSLQDEQDFQTMNRVKYIGQANFGGTKCNDLSSCAWSRSSIHSRDSFSSVSLSRVKHLAPAMSSNTGCRLACPDFTKASSTSVALSPLESCRMRNAQMVICLPSPSTQLQAHCYTSNSSTFFWML